MLMLCRYLTPLLYSSLNFSLLNSESYNIAPKCKQRCCKVKLQFAEKVVEKPGNVLLFTFFDLLICVEQ